MTSDCDGFLTKVLAFSGAVPFIFGAFLLLNGISSLPMLGSVAKLVLTYGLVIVSFMAGAHWGQNLSGIEGTTGLFWKSNFLTVSAWLAFALLKPSTFAVVLILIFATLYWIDRRLAFEGVISKSYLKTRLAVTGLVCLSLALTATAIA